MFPPIAGRSFDRQGGVSLLVLHARADAIFLVFSRPWLSHRFIGDDHDMKLTPWCIAAIAPIAVAGCSGTLFGHVAVLAVAIGIFFGTLSLGRHATPVDGATLSGQLLDTPVHTPVGLEALAVVRSSVAPGPSSDARG